MTDHDEIAGMIAAYALDALDDADERRVAAHIDSCPSCAEAYREASVTVGLLARSAEPVAPPPALRGRLLAAIAAEPVDELAARRARPRRIRGWRTAAAVAGVAAVAASALAVAQQRTIDDLRADRATVAAAGPVAVLVGTGGKGVLISRLAAAPGGKTYQFWAIPPGSTTPESLGIVSGDGVLRLARTLPAGTTVAVTIEPAGGSPAPTTTPFATIAI
jgi:anti-sigma-K factor RskA